MTSIIEMLIDSLRERAKASTVKDVRIGPFYGTVAVDTPTGLKAGLAATMMAGHHARGVGSSVAPSGLLLGLTPLELMAYAGSPSQVEAALGLATINALLEIDEAACVQVNASEVILERGAGKRVVIVGHFPFVEQVREAVPQLSVLELHPREGDLPASAAEQVIPKADVVAITGTTLVNHTFDGLIALCRPDAYVLILGGSTPLSPLFFPLGVSLVAGTQLTDIEGALLAISQGAGYRQIPGRRLLTLAAPE